MSQVVIKATSHNHRGRKISLTKRFSVDGTGVTQVEAFLNKNYHKFHPYLGTLLTVDWGKGPSEYILEEDWGEMFLERLS